jgi:hypothetical protein
LLFADSFRRVLMNPIAVRVMAVVPLPAELGGAGDVLALAAFGSVRLPSGDVQPGESIFAATARMVRQVTGAAVRPERVIYLHEQAGRELLLCVLCALDADDTDAATPTRVGVRFVPADAFPDDFEPAALREMLVEDSQQGFVRPVAHIMLTATDDRERVEIIW